MVSWLKRQVNPSNQKEIENVGRQEAGGVGGETQAESQIESNLKRLHPYQGEHAADLSSLSNLQSDFYLSSGTIQCVEGKEKR